jgi:hypothetical protein
MDHTADQLRVFLSMFMLTLPTFLVCAVACVVVVGRWGVGSRYSFWAMAGFGLALLVCIIGPAVQTLLQQWVFQSGDRISRAWVFSTFGLVLSVLHAAIYGCLLAAVLADRPQTSDQ